MRTVSFISQLRITEGLYRNLHVQKNPTIMLLRRSVHILPKHLSIGVTFQNASIVRNTHTFYNRPEAIEYLAVNLKERRKLLELKAREPKPPPPRSAVDTSFVWYSSEAPKVTAVQFSILHIKDWWEYYKQKSRLHEQRFIPLRHKILGNNLAAAHFILAHGGRVKFEGNPNWITKESEEFSNIPKVYDPAYLVTALDLNGLPLAYDGLENIRDLYKLQWLSLKGCETIDDWGLDKLSGEYPMLEHLDISGCKRITERGLEALYRMPNLKKLIVSNYGNHVAFELTCLMLEDVNPYLTCEIQVPKETNVADE